MLVDNRSYYGPESMVCCLNPDCENPLNPDKSKYCQSCGIELIHLLRNRYRSTQPLSRGGFGQTYLAEDADKLNKPCVIKQLLYQSYGSKKNQKIVELFMREAKQLYHLKENPQIPDLLAYFEESGYLYLVQDYVAGQDLLRELQQQGPFSEDKITALLFDLLPVLQFIHERGVIHRDLKPENIMRREQDSRLVLIDFGVARQISMKQRTGGGTRVGSPGYFSIEQFSDGKATISSDLYSLGATLFHLLTGQSPSDLWSTQGYGWVSDWQQHLLSPIHPALSGVITKLLQIKAEDRYQITSAVLADLHPQPVPSISLDSPSTRSPSLLTQLSSGVKPVPTASSLNTLPLPTVVLSESRGSRSSKPVHSPHLKNRRQLLTLVLFGGVGLGGAWLWKAIGNRSNTSDSSSELASETPPESSQSPPILPSSSDLTLERFDFEVVRINAQGKIIHRRPQQAQFFTESLDNDTPLEMVAIPDGTYTMGSPLSERGRLSHEGPQREVVVPAFYMGKFQVTQAQWQAIMGSNSSNFKGANRPVENVSWSDAVEFCRKLSQKSGRNYRLPSEAEWEYACRARTVTPFYFGETITTDLANYRGTDVATEATFDSGQYNAGPKGQYRKQTLTVGSFPPNSFGLYDMHANVLEWCQDTWHNSYTGAPTDGSAWIEQDDKSLRIVRGGSWANIPMVCRSASRGKYYPNYKNDAFGLRIICSVP